MRLFPLPVLVFLTLGVVPAGKAEPSSLPGIVGTDDRVPFEPLDWPWSAIGRVNREEGGYCTGTVVGRRLVLTAAHCLLHPRTRKPLPAYRIHFVAGYRRGEYSFHAKAASYRTGTAEAVTTMAAAAGDWAVLELDADIPIKPLPVLVPETGGKPLTLTRAGYSRDRAHLPMRATGCRLVGHASGLPLLLHDCDATLGDSGSALLAETKGGPVVVGLHVGVSTVEGMPRNIAVSAAAFAPAVGN